MSSITAGVHIDWLTLTVKGGFDAPDVSHDSTRARDIAGDTLALLGGATPAEYLYATRPDFGYAYGFVDPNTTVKVNVGANLEQQGLSVVASGQALTSRVNGALMLQSGLQQGFKPTRIDVAFDFQNSNVPVRQMCAAYEVYQGQKSARRTSFIKGRTGDTFTIGARSSEKYLRVYDKAGEQGIAGDWVRVEIELKGLAATEYAQDIADAPASAAVLIAPLFAGSENVIAVALNNIAGGYDPARPITRPEVSGNKLLWLKKSVSPTLVKMYQSDRPSFEAFMRDLANKLDEVDPDHRL